MESKMELALERRDQQDETGSTVSVHDLGYSLTPVPSTTRFGRSDERFVCDACGHEKLLTNNGDLYHTKHVRAHDHYRGECPVWRISDYGDPPGWFRVVVDEQRSTLVAPVGRDETRPLAIEPGARRRSR